MGFPTSTSVFLHFNFDSSSKQLEIQDEQNLFLNSQKDIQILSKFKIWNLNMKFKLLRIF